FTHLINSGGSWREVDFTNREGLVNGVFSGSELEFDSEGNAYWADGSDVVRGISKDQEYFEFEGSLPGYYYGCLDFEIKQDTLYMYHIAGDKNWPYGDAVLFFESIGTLGASAQEGDDCEEAINIQSLLSNNPGEVNTSGVYDNTGYSPSSLADECFTIEQSIWYSFVGNGNRYNFTAIQCGADIDEYIDDSQVHIYSGDCNNLVFEDCNDDGGSLAFNLNFETEEGKQYYLIVDGYDTNEGQFCLEVTNLEGQNQEGDDCDQAFDIQSLLGNQAGEVNTSGVYDNTGYNPSNLADACYGLEQTIWFSFTGNGRSYNFTAIQCGADIDEYIDDSQVHIYSGDCNNLVFEDCNDDGATLAFDLDLETEQGKQYYLIVDGFLGFEGKFCLQVTETSTSSEENILQNINIYPNPALDFIMIEGFEGDRLELIDLTGKVIRSWTGHQQQLQLQGLPSGSYFLRMYDDDNSFLRKIVKL
ncbi:MAG TPA: T9SS type A sorting domain-containing protein, partial [Saprospiraceae bacterium]|nr:T9SS type A sorting domain-containing protein [Saprospiraceae bacterium]